MRNCFSCYIFRSLVLALLCGSGTPVLHGGEEPATVTETATAEQPVDFARDIAPLFAKNCTACHNSKKSEGGLNLESHAQVMVGGDSGPAVVASNKPESYLLARVLDADDPMPPADNTVGAKAFNPDEVALLEHWIESGALDSTSTPTGATPMDWQRIPEELTPVYALDASRDDLYLAVGRGNVVQLSQLAGPAAAAPVQPLIDADLHLPDGTPLPATHLDIVQSLAFSPDSQVLATGGFRSLKLWRRDTQAKTMLDGLAVTAGLSAVSPNGRRLASVTGDTGLELVDLETEQAHRFLKSHLAPVTALVWLTDQALLSSDQTGKLVLTDADTYRALPLQVNGAIAAVRQWACIKERTLGMDEAGVVFELRSEGNKRPSDVLAEPQLSFVAEPIALPETATAIAPMWLPEPCLLVALKNQTLARVSLESGEVLSEAKTSVAIQRMSASSTGETLLVIPEAGPVQLWKGASGELLATLDQDYTQAAKYRARQRDATRQQAFVEQLAGTITELQKAATAETEAHKKVLESREQAVAALATKDTELTTARTGVSETEQALAAAMQRVTELNSELEAKRKAAQEMETKRAAAEAELASREQALATAADGVARAAERVTMTESQKASEQERLAALQMQVAELQASVATPPATNCVFSADGNWAIVAGSDHVLRLFSATDGRAFANLTGAAAPILAVHATPERQLRALTADGHLLRWDLNVNWTLERTIGTAEESPFSDRISALDFSPDGRWLAVGSGPPSRFGDIRILDVATGTIAKDLGEAHSDTVLSLKFSPDGRMLASGGADKLCRLWEVESAAALRAFEGHTHHVLGIAWQDNGQRIATASADQSVKLWNVESGEQIRTIAGFGHEVTAVEFVGESAQLFCVAADGSVKLFNSDDGKAIRNFGGADNALYTVAVTADAARVAAAGQAGKVWTWQVEDGKLLEPSK